MARKLPWVTGGNSSDKVKPRVKARSLPSHHRAASTSDLDSNTSTPVKKPQSRSVKNSDGARSSKVRERSLSSSPPPAPPDIEFMREDGEDDMWIMVEDEFMSTANEFTRHLHHTAYKERKAEAARRLAASSGYRAGLPSIRETLAQKQTPSGITIPEDPDSEEAQEADALTFNDRRLAGLMLGHSSRASNSKTRLDEIAPHLGSKSKSQAAAGFGRPNHSPATRLISPRMPREQDTKSTLQNPRGNDALDSTDDDDLDAISNMPSSPPIPRCGDLDSSKTQAFESNAGLGSSMLGKPLPKLQDQDTKSRVPNSVRVKEEEQEDDGGFPVRRRIGASSLAEWRARRAAKRLKREQEENDEQGKQAKEEIPMFII